MKPDNTNIGEGESLEYAPAAAQDSGMPTVVVPEAERRRLSPFRYNKLAFVIAGLAVLLITAVAVGSFVLLNRPSSQKNVSDQAANYKVGDISLQDVQANAQLKVGTADKLAINGQLQVSNTLVLAPTPTPTAPTRGQIYFDQVTNQPYYYDGVRFVSLAPTVLPQVVNSIGGFSGAVGLGTGLEVVNGQLGVSAVFSQQLGGARVTSLQGQTGDVQLVAGNGVGINGTTISNQGVINLNAGSGISVTADGNGAYTVTNTVVGLSGTGSAGQIAMFTGSQALGDSILSQSGSALTATGTLTVTGAISANTLQQTAPGLDVSISAGNDDLVFTAGGRTFVFPTSGPASQTICTTGVSCASGGGQAVILQPGSVQTDSGSDESVFINNTGGGTLIRLQGNGNDRLVIANNGNTTIGGSLTVQGSGGLLVGVPGSVNGAITIASNLNTNTGSVQIASLGQNTIYTLPDPGSGAATICLSTGNCSGGGVTSLNGLTGALILNNSSGVGSTVTIDDASTSVKGIAQFNATNFTASSGTINTIQDIATTSAPTFGGLTLTSALTVANGGTGTSTFTSNGILFGNGTGALQSTAAAANSVLVTNGSSVPSLSQTLPTAVQGNITTTGVLISGSIAAGFGTISTNSNISTTATVQGATVNATTALQLNGNDINNPGTLSNVAYENQANNFTSSNTFSAAGTGLAVTNNATIGGTLAVQGAGGITAGVAGATTGTINLANTTSTRMVSLQGLNPSGTGNAIIQFPTIAGGSTDTVCLFTLGNCVSGVTSINGQTGAVTINNASGSGGAITIDDASTSTKGIAQFNATNFTASSGTINTIQGIATISAPTFAGLTLTSALTVANGGTGASTFTSNGILYGNGTGALQVTVSAANSILATNGSSVPSLVQTLPSAVQGNITSTGALTSGSIASGFGTISTGNSITTTAAVQGATINATSALQVGGVDINTAGTLTNVAYENQANNFTSSNTFSAAGTALAVTNNATIGGTLNGQTISSAANFTGTLAVQGAGGITVGVAGSVAGNLSLANSGSTRLVTIQGLNPSGTGNATVQVPTIAGGSTDTFCLQTLGNCATAGAITGSGTTNYLARFTGASTLGIGTIYDNGTAVSIGGSSPSALFNVGASNQFQVSSTGAVTAVGLNSGSGLIQGTGGLTAGGTITFSSLNSAGVVKTDGLGQLSTGIVALGTETSGDYVANLGTLTGLSTTGNSGEGSTPSLSVLYGSSANTAVQGNTSLTCASGTGNLSGGGNSVTLGAGGSCNNITISNSPTFSGTVTVQGAGGVVLGVAGATTGSLNLANSANANIGTLQIASLGQATTFVLPDPGQASVNICLSTGNCAGSGGGITGSGTTGRLSKFSGSGTITDSTLSESGSTLTASGNLVIQGTNSLTLGVASATDGSIAFKNSSGTRTVTLQAPQTDPAGDITFFLPNADGSNGDCLTTDGTGGLAFTSCTGGAGGGVTSLNGQTGVVNINNASGSGGAITIDNASTSAKGIAQFNATNFTASSGTINTIQDIATTSSPTFAGLTLTNDLTVANGGTGASTFTSNGILYGNGTGALQVTAAAANSILVTNGSNIPSLSQTLPTAVQGNITSTGALTSGSIASGFGTISTGNNITTTATVQGGTLNGISVIQLNGADINTAGTLTNLAYLNQSNTFTNTNLFQPSSNSTTAFRIQNASSQNLFVADTTNQRVAVGPAATPANGVLTVGTNTTAASGGVYFGTDTNLYRSGAAALTTNSYLQATGFGATSSSTGTGVGTSIQNYHVFTVNPASTSARSNSGTAGVTWLQGSSSMSGDQFGAEFLLNNSSTGTISGALVGLKGRVGFVSGGIATGTGYTAASTGVFGQIHGLNTGGVVSEANGLAANALLTAGSIATFSGLRVYSPDVTGTGAITNSYGLYLEAQQVSGVTNGYGIYQAGANDINTLAGATTFTNNVAVQGGGGLTLGVQGSVTGNLNLANSTSSRMVILQGLNPSGTGNATVQIPTIAGGSTDTVCLLTLSNCALVGGITGSGTANYTARFTGANTIAIGTIYDNGTLVSVGGSSPSALFNVGASNQFQVSSTGAVTAVGVNAGAGVIQGTGGLSVTGGSTLGGTITLSALGTGLVQSNGSGVLSSGAVDRNSATFFNNALSVANGGTGAATFTSNGILYGNGTGALQVTGAAANSILVTSGANVPSLSQTLPTAVQGNITGTGALTSGSIASGFGTISTGNNITSSATVQGGIVNGTTAIQLNGTDINTAGTLTNVAYENQANTFTQANVFNAAGTALSVSNDASIGGTLAVQGGGGLTLGVQGSVTGNLNLANSTSSRMVVLQGLNPSGTGNATVQIPTIAGGSTDTVCLLTLGNCSLAGGISGSGTANYTARFTGANTIAIGTIYDDGSLVSVGGGSPSALFNVGASNQFQVSSTGAVTAVGVNAGAGAIQGTGGLNVTGGSTLGGTTTLSALGAGLVQSSSGGVLSSGAVDRNSATFFNTTLSVANGGTGAATFATNGILYGNGTSALQVTAAAANSILVTNGSNVPSLSQTLPTAVQGNITGTGALTSGSIASGFGTISTGNNITTTATVQGGTLNGTSAIQLNGVDINTAGTLTNVAYENQANTFTQTNTFSGNVNANGTLTVTNGNASGGLQVYSGSSIVNSTIGFGRSTAEFQFGISSGAGQYIAGTQSGDLIQKQLGSGAIILTNGTNPDLSVLGGNVGIGVRAASTKLDVRGTTRVAVTSSTAFQVQDGSLNPAVFTVDTSGNTLSSTGALTVTNGAATGGIRLLSGGASTNSTFALGRASSDFQIGIAGSTGQFIAGTSTSDVIQRHLGSGAIILSNGTNPDLSVLGGNVGIGMRAATYKLDVTGGDINTSGTYRIAGIDINTAGTLTNVAYENQANTFTAANLFQNSSDSTTAFRIQNAAGTSNLFMADTTNTRIGIGASPATSLLTVGTNTTTATGGITFGTDTNLYRSAADTLRTDDSLSVGGTLTVTGASALRGGATLGIAGSAIGQLVFAHSGNTNLGTVQIASLGQATTFTLPDPGGASATICLSTGNCAGAGTGITGTGTSGQLARFSSANNIVDSTLSESGSVLTASGTMVIQGASSLTLGTSSTNDGAIVFRNNSGANTVTLAAPLNNPASSLTFRLPSADGGIGDCLVTDASGNLSFAACGGGGGGVTSLDGQTGAVTVDNATGAGGVITIDNASTSQKGIAQFNSTNFTASSGTINTIQDIATTSSPTFATLNATSGLQLNGVNINTAGTLTNVAYENQANTFTEANLFRNTTNSTAAFQIQDSAGTGYLLTADTSNGVIKVGTTASATQGGTALFATAAEFSGALRVGDGTNRVQVDGTTKKITYVGTARQDRRVTLHPEYAGAVLTADGTNNTGTMTSDFCSGSSRLNINSSICGSTDEFNYYSWIGSGGTMDYDIYVRWQVPSDFDGFKDATDAVKMYGWRTTSGEAVDLAMFQANGTQCGSTTTITSSNTTWQQTSMTGDETACSVAANDVVTFRVKLTASSSGYARAGNIQINYLSSF